jgi:hypothetical protein
MYKRFCASLTVMLYLGSAAFATMAAAAATEIEVTVRGKLVHGKTVDSIDSKELFVSSDQADGEVLFRLAWHGNHHANASIEELVDQEVIIVGQLKRDQKVRSRANEAVRYEITVTGMSIAKTGETIIGTNGRWIVFSYGSGLTISDKDSGKTHVIYKPSDHNAASAVNWSASAEFSPSGQFMYSRSGLNDHLWQLPDFKPIEFKTVPDRKSMITLGYGGFVDGEKFLVMHGYSRPKIPDSLLVFNTKTGEELARIDFSQPTFDSQFVFVGKKKTTANDDPFNTASLIVCVNQQVHKIELESGTVSTLVPTDQ